MANDEDGAKQALIVEARARNISHNVRCTECGSQSIEDSQADIAVLLRKLIRDEIHAGQSDKDIYKKLEDEYGETVLYAPKFDMQTAAIWLSPLLVAGGAVGVWAYKKHKEKTNVHIMALNLVRGVALTPKEKKTMLDILTPPPPRNTPLSWWKRRPIAYLSGILKLSTRIEESQMDRAEENYEGSKVSKAQEVSGSMSPMYQSNEKQLLGKPWSTGLFDCNQNEANAVMTAFFPCVTFGQISEVLDEGEMPCHLGSFIYLLMMPALCSQWVMGSKYRAKLRKKYGLVEAPYTDVISHVFCPCCSLCQEFRELKFRGLDPVLGWNGILAQQQEKQSQDQTVGIPPSTQAMSK